ncbi:MAG TPA: DinB family protein [Pirellulales bacterium]|jgi:hypothetical protein|nr:DinB family protein [Pirellulales bacterium]
MLRELIARYLAGADRLGPALDGLSEADLDAFPVPETWSIRQIIHHLYDSDLIASDRMKRIIAEENPVLVGFDESAFARNLCYDQLDAHLAVDVIVKNRRLTQALLSRLNESAFQRIGTHNERGPMTLEHLLKTYTDHLEHHLKFVDQKRKLLGK